MSDPILIVGAGPTGLIAALELSRFGIPVRLIDVGLAGLDGGDAQRLLGQDLVGDLIEMGRTGVADRRRAQL